MNYSRLLPTLLGFICLSIAITISFRKSPHSQPPPRCESLHDGMQNNDVNEVKIQITRFIDALPSQLYTAQNLDKLVAAISGQCGATAQVLCFDCVKTYPGQTEIKISFPASSIQKVIDISYTLSINKMKVISMHD